MGRQRGFTCSAARIILALTLRHRCTSCCSRVMMRSQIPPAKIQCESQVWHVQLRGTNAAQNYLAKWGHSLLLTPVCLPLRGVIFIYSKYVLMHCLWDQQADYNNQHNLPSRTLALAPSPSICFNSSLSVSHSGMLWRDKHTDTHTPNAHTQAHL